MSDAGRPSHRAERAFGPRWGSRAGWVAALSVAAQLAVFAWGGALHREQRLFGDEPEYWQLSQGGLFSQLRPIGYPLLVHLLRGAGDSTAPLFVVQSIVALLAPLSVLVLLERPLARRPGVALAAALASALSFTALTLTKRVLADSLCGALGALALALLLSNPQRSARKDWAAGAVAALTLLVKPIFQLWLPIALGTLVLHRSTLRAGARSAGRLLLLPVLVWSAGTLAVSQRCGVPTYSLIGGLAVQRYWLPATRCLAASGGSWSDACIEGRRAQLDVEAFYRCPTPAPELNRLRREARAQLATHPVAATAALAGAFWRNLPRPFHAHELDAVAPPAVVRALRPVRFATPLCWLAALVGLARLWRSDRALALSMALAGAAFGVATSISFWEGARLLYPVEPLMFAAAGVGLAGLADLVRRPRRGAA